jgi:hypothetical protein
MLEVVQFEAETYGEEVAAILALRGGGEVEMPLTRSGSAEKTLHQSAKAALAGKTARELFSQSGTPEAALSGLYLYLGRWEEAHEHADAAESRENYFWHAIVHRQEPDAWNSGYWFRKTGAHPLFPRLAKVAQSAGYGSGNRWDPIAFVDYCERVRGVPGSEEERLARRVQLIEWQLLFDYSARESRH